MAVTHTTLFWIQKGTQLGEHNGFFMFYFKGVQ